MIKSFPNREALAAAGLPTTESRVALIEDENDVVVDGVNVIKDIPRVGDPVYTDTSGNVYIIDRDTFNASLVPSDWTYRGSFLKYWDADTFAVFNGNFASLPTKKYADFVKFSLDAPTLDGAEHTASIQVRVSTNYGTAYTINYTYTASALSDVVTALNAAIEAAKVADGWTNVLWAYLGDADGNKVSSDADATQIIVQFDTWDNYQQYLCAGMTHITWGDMPAANTYFKRNGRTTSSRGLMTIEGGAAYWSANGRTLTENVTVGGETGATAPMSLYEYQSSPYAAAIREAYPTYEDYLRGEFGILDSVKYGVFALPDAKALTEEYGPVMVPTKDGGAKAGFPALNWAYTLEGDNYLWGVDEGVIIMDDDNRAAINATQAKASKVNITFTSRWFAQRCSVFHAWSFSGTTRNVRNSTVYYAFQVGAVTLLKYK